MPRKNAVPVQRTCEVCRTIWTPRTRYQAVRNKTCSPKCAAISIGRKNLGRSLPMEMHKGKRRATCAACGKMFWRNAKYLDRRAKPVCSRKCNGVFRGMDWAKHGHKGAAARKTFTRMYGPKNPAWKGGVTYRNRHGNYVSVKYIRCPIDLISMARTDGYVMEHRAVMARWIGRQLIRVECVHHIDHQPLNNARTNLELWPCNRSHKSAEHGIVVEGAANRLFLTA